MVIDPAVAGIRELPLEQSQLATFGATAVWSVSFSQRHCWGSITYQRGEVSIDG